VTQLAPIDALVLGILGVAALRGFFLGLIREAFSLAALGAAYIVVRVGNPTATAWLGQAAGESIGPALAPWIAGVALAVATIATVVFLGRLLRRGARWAGLGWADRVGGGVLGLAEGALVAAILLTVASTLLGRDHTFLARSGSLRAYEELQRVAEARSPEDLPDVAAPPRE